MIFGDRDRQEGTDRTDRNKAKRRKKLSPKTKFWEGTGTKQVFPKIKFWDDDTFQNVFWKET